MQRRREVPDGHIHIDDAGDRVRGVMKYISRRLNRMPGT